ncbi:MAG: CDP-glycerol glycerophosphotransferase family protein [Muricoprocola sp.]
MKISVIVAAYNAQEYLEECLESILQQGISDYEIIVVNDGSTDRTAEILDRYAERYDQITVLHKENGGPSSARNRGLDIAKGEYIAFLDSDDWMANNALKQMYDVAKERDADLVIGKYDIFNKYRSYNVHNLDELVVQEDIDKYDCQILWTFSLCNKLFRRNVIEENHIRFAPISYSEDGVFVMSFVYHCKKISGLDEVIFHYRRLNDGNLDSITATASTGKTKEYITAHHMILDAAGKSILRDFPQYRTIEEAMGRDERLCQYMNHILRKEVHTLLNQFYSKYWSLDAETIDCITEEVHKEMKEMDLQSFYELAADNPDISLNNLYKKPEDILSHAKMTAALYALPEQEEAFAKCLLALQQQSLVATQIVVPENMRSLVEKHGLSCENIKYLSEEMKEKFYFRAMKEAQSDYIVLCTPRFVYTNNAFKHVLKRFLRSQADFFTELVCHLNYGEQQPVFIHQLVFDTLKEGLEETELLSADYLVENKFFRTEFLRTIWTDVTIPLRELVKMCFRKGYYQAVRDGIVVFQDKEEKFLTYIETEENRSIIKKALEEKPLDLAAQESATKKALKLTRLQDILERDDQTEINEQLKKDIEELQKQKIEKQVLFLSIRKDGELEGNAKALYPYIKGKKVVIAKQLPHTYEEEVNMIREITRSKVIITDDYVRDLRYFPLKGKQRVIQLWHACGAFKKFGQRGTNISKATDRATHAQYDAVCVSGEAVRPVYADAFGLDIDKIKALGVPRTDLFFDEKYKKQIRRQIFKKYPSLRFKEVILYAPTFRDIGDDRTQFHPELDFGRLSKKLRWNQVFVVCPHPVMKNDIVDKTYKNIKVIRDFSTNEMMFVSDMLITDYSSVIFEYALLKKPIAFYCYDLPIYNRGFYLNYPEDLPGDVYQTQEELEEFLRDKKKHVADEKHESFVKKYMSACDGHSCERIASLINGYMSNKPTDMELKNE